MRRRKTLLLWLGLGAAALYVLGRSRAHASAIAPQGIVAGDYPFPQSVPITPAVENPYGAGFASPFSGIFGTAYAGLAAGPGGEYGTEYGGAFETPVGGFDATPWGGFLPDLRPTVQPEPPLNLRPSILQ
jgi:hypothetical protein